MNKDKKTIKEEDRSMIKQIIDEYLEKLQKGYEKGEANIFLIEKLQLIQAENLAKELISVAIQKSDKTVIIKFNLI